MDHGSEDSLQGDKEPLLISVCNEMIFSVCFNMYVKMQFYSSISVLQYLFLLCFSHYSFFYLKENTLKKVVLKTVTGLLLKLNN